MNIKQGARSRHHTTFGLAAAILAAALAAPASAYDLRLLSVAAGMAPGTAPTDADTRFIDRFTDGNPLVGPAYMNGTTGTGAYLVYGTPSPGTELTAPASDWFGQNFGIGRYRFQLADASASPSNLDAAGMMTMRESLILRRTAQPPLLTPNQSWEVETYWNYALPDAGSTYGIRLSDNTQTVATAGVPFNDLIDLRLVRNAAGNPVVNFRRLEWDGSALTATQNFNFLLSAALAPGKTLDDIAAIGFRLHYNPAGQFDAGGIIAGLDLVGAQNEDVGYINYAPILQIFRGEDFTSLVANASWSVPVPEPATWALWAAGMGVLVVRRRR